jgi:UDP:flavonoid glycosyltransferase YjiC (YdhE family)
MTFDQRDNGVRVRRLGVGQVIRSSRCTAERMTEALHELLQRDVKLRCRQIAERFDHRNVLEEAATLVETVLWDGQSCPSAFSVRERPG